VPEGRPSFVLDASVIINFLGSGMPEPILESLGAELYVAKQVFLEVVRDPSRRIAPQAWLRQIEARGLIEVIKPAGESLETYLELVSAPPPGRLDDGEAATLAVALQLGATPALDEKRARRVSQSRYPGLLLSSTAALFRHASESGRIAQDQISLALFNALSLARMQVQPEMAEWVVNCIGAEKAQQCLSLPSQLREAIASKDR
jgi:predicted nucleic acid-binding protein